MLPAADTIAAIATARGRAALAIIRLSGPEALSIAAACFRGADLRDVASHTVHFGYAAAPDGREIDQIVATVFRAPRSSTGEDVVEFTCHGGDIAPQLILKCLVARGARHATPGEFTQRAFINGKMDLTQAEAVADLIHASSSLAHRVSLSQLEGRYSEQLQALRDELLEVCAYVELELDFSEEDVSFADSERLRALLDESERLLKDLLSSYRIGALIRDGVLVVIGGRPNAGKSTLLNALVGWDRAIVSEAPGTTRDEIEVDAEIEGLLFRFVDTAGLRETADFVEAEGVRRARRSIERSDVLVYVFDLVQGLDREELAFLQDVKAAQPDLAVVLVGNKEDLTAHVEAPEELVLPFLAVSAERGRQEASETRPLVDTLLELVAAGLSQPDASPVVVNQRHRAHLAEALEAVQRSKTALRSGASGDTLALDLRVALHELGAITGEITNEDVLDQIFSRFCIGK